MKSSNFILCLLLSFIGISLIPTMEAADILFFMGLASHSHRVALQPLALKLAERGHQVTFLTYTKSETPNPNITEFFPEAAGKFMSSQLNDLSVDAVQGRLKSRFYDTFARDPDLTWEIMLPGVEATVLNQDFRQWLNSSKFDLVIYDSPFKEIALGIAYKMKAKVIAFQTTATQHIYDFEMFGLPAESSWLPDWSGGSEYMLISHRFFYAYNALRWYFSFKWNYLAKVDDMLTKLYGETLPTTEELARKVDLIFLNEHFTINFPRSLPPFVVPVGGMHCKESKGVLPQDMEDFLKTKNRFMFLSFGSAVKVSALPVEKQTMLFEAVESITNTNFLWKWEGEIPKNLPKNVFAQNWFPQQDVLAHPKIKGFLTQGGGMSSQQANFHGVPMIVVPIWGDQTFVAQSAVYQGNGIHLELTDINKESLAQAFREILDNEKYGQAAKEVSRRFKDRPLSSVETAVWWTEYVLRHDTAHLKSPGIQQYWWQRRLLDFWFVIFSFISLIGYFLLKLQVLLLKKYSSWIGNTSARKG